MNKNIVRAVVVVGASFAAQLSHAAAIDVSSAVTEIEGIAAPAGLIGLAMLGVLASIKAWKVVRRAM